MFSDSANKLNENNNTANTVHINKSNNNDQLSENKQQNSHILNEIHTNFQKHANEMKGNIYRENIFYL